MPSATPATCRWIVAWTLPPDLVKLTDLLQPKPAWELALDALKRLSRRPHRRPDRRQPAPGLAADPARQLRHLEPREQKRTKSGGWTRGRAVSVQRLYEEAERMPHLTPQDRAICACIVKEQPPRFYGASRWVYLLDLDRALIAAVGHPRLLATRRATNRWSWCPPVRP
jgi:hypothetical protein